MNVVVQLSKTSDLKDIQGCNDPVSPRSVGPIGNISISVKRGLRPIIHDHKWI